MVLSFCMRILDCALMHVLGCDFLLESESSYIPSFNSFPQFWAKLRVISNRTMYGIIFACVRYNKESEETVTVAQGR